MLLQNSKLLGHDSILTMMVEPVVVKPLMVSNMASTTLMPYSTYGMAPNTVTISQALVTTNSASVARVISAGWKRSSRGMPSAAVSRNGYIHGRRSSP